VHVVADNGYQGAGPAVQVPQRRRRLDRETGRYRRLSQNQKDVNTAHARQRGPGERANAQLKSWKILRRIRSCPTRATDLVNAVQVLIHEVSVPALAEINVRGQNYQQPVAGQHRQPPRGRRCSVSTSPLIWTDRRRRSDAVIG
jgi:hypothetical protein